MKNLYALLIAIFFILNVANAQWQQCTTPETFYGPIDVKGNTLFCSNGSNKIYYSNDFGQNWTACNTFPYNPGSINDIKNNGSSIYVASNYGLFTSSDNGLNWSRIKNDGEEDHIALKGSYIFACNYMDYLYSSNNNGNTWINASNNLSLIYKRAFYVNGNDLFCGGGGSCSIYKTLNDGTVWFCSGTGLPTGIDISTMAGNGNNIFAGSFSNGAYFSSDNGLNWTAVNSGLSDQYIVCLTSYGTNIFLGTSTAGFYRSSNNGTNWVMYNDGLTDMYINSVAVCGTYIYLTTYNGGIWRRPLNQVGIKESDLNDKTLSIFPNPAKNKININLQQNGEMQKTKLSILDSQGKLILQQTLIQSQTEINLADFAKGIYIVKINNDKISIVKKFTKE